jgi:transcriptional regulator with XRE-family HTH domain
MTKAELLMYSDAEIAAEIGRYSKEKRLFLNVSQKDFAKEVGMSHISYVEFENTGKTSTLKLIKILRRLNLLGDMMMGVANQNSIENLGVEEYYKRSTSKPRLRTGVKRQKDS